MPQWRRRRPPFDATRAAPPGAGAAPQPTVQQVQAKINKLTTQFNKITEQYDQASQQLSAAKSKLSQVRKHLTHARAQFQAAQANVAQTAASRLNGAAAVRVEIPGVPTDGSVTLGGAPITGLAPHRTVAAGLARSFQITCLLPDFTAAENVAMPLLLRGDDFASALGMALKWLAEVGVATSSTLCSAAHSRISGVQCSDRLSLTR